MSDVKVDLGDSVWKTLCISLLQLAFERGNRLDIQQKSPVVGREGPCRLAEAEVYKGLKIYVITLLALTEVAWTIVGHPRCDAARTLPPQHSLLRSRSPILNFLELSERAPHMGEPHVLSRTDIKTTFLYPNPYSYPAASFYVFIFFVRLFPNPLAAYLTFVPARVLHRDRLSLAARPSADAQKLRFLNQHQINSPREKIRST